MELNEQTLLISDDTELPQIQCKSNIFNAYLLVHFREDLKLKENDQLQDTTWLGVFAYFIAAVQWAALILLSAIVIDNSGVISPWVEMHWIPADWNTLVMFPFFVIAVITCRKDIHGHKLYQDWMLFQFSIFRMGFILLFSN
eukprot:405091_1